MSTITTLVLLLFGLALFVGIPLMLLRASSPTVARVVEVVAVVTIAVVGLFALVALYATFIGDQTVVAVALEPRVPAVDIPGLELDPPIATILAADGATASYTVSGLTWLPRTLLAAANLLQAALTIYFAWTIRKLARNVRKAVPFEGLSQLLVGGGVLLFAAYLTWSILGSTGSAIAAEQALGIHGASYTGDNPLVTTAMQFGDYSSLGWPQPANWGVMFDSAPVGIAFALVLVGAAFAAGERMQRDTEGLV